MKRLGLAAGLAGVCALCGCTFNNPWNTPVIPWWKGIPTQILAPNSLEAEVWRERHRGQEGHATAVGPVNSVGPSVDSHTSPDVVPEEATPSPTY